MGGRKQLKACRDWMIINVPITEPCVCSTASSIHHSPAKPVTPVSHRCARLLLDFWPALIASNAEKGGGLRYRSELPPRELPFVPTQSPRARNVPADAQFHQSSFPVPHIRLRFPTCRGRDCLVFELGVWISFMSAIPNVSRSGPVHPLRPCVATPPILISRTALGWLDVGQSAATQHTLPLSPRTSSHLGPSHSFLLSRFRRPSLCVSRQYT